MAASGPFPLLVEGSWGPDPPKTLINKLQTYFQSRKKSGGGECEVVLQPGSPASFLVLFSPEDVRQNVLEKENHELVWPGKGTFKLTVRLPKDTDEASVSKEAVPDKESKTKNGTAGKDDLDTTHSHSNRSEKKEDVSKECETVPSMVAFENLPEKVTDIVLTFLVENISGLPSTDFKVEVIRDFGVVVVTFQKPIDTKKFIIDCMGHHWNQQLQLAPRLLETTNVVRVENLPPGVDDYQLQLYFENPFNGGGRVTQVECFPEDSSALVEFSDCKVLDTILAKKHSFNRMPLSVFPYYPSLGTALYGEEKPLVKLPASFQESLGLPLWKFFQKHNHLIEEINDKMRRCHCELTWSDINGTVTVRPAASLVSHRPSIKTWQRDASEVLSDIKAKYEVKVFEVYLPVWDIIQHEVGDDRVLIEFDKESLTLAGKSEDVQDIGQKIKELIDSTTEKVRKEEQSLKEKMAISPGKHFLLQHSGFLEDLSKENPEVEIHYDAATQHLCFKGFCADVYKVKCDIKEKVYSMAQKDVQIPSEVFMFLQQVDSQEFSKTLFEAQKILAKYELNGTTLLLMACSFRALAEAEKKMLDALSYKIIDVEDKEVFGGNAWKKKIHSLQKRHSSRASITIKDELTSETPAEVIIAGCVKQVNEIYGQLFEFLENTLKIERLVKIESVLIFEYLRSDRKLFWPKIKKANVQARFNLQDEPKGILLTGSKSKVLECMNMVRQIRDSVCIKRFQIDKPGARHFFQDKASYYKSEIKRLYGCIIELQEGAEKDKGSLKEQKCLLQKDIVPGVTLIVQQGDLARFPADVVVNAANEHLKHIDGLALALSNAAGPELQVECDKIVRKGGVVKTGNAIISKPGKLPCHHVIHAVGPRWDGNKAQECVSLLKRAVERSLTLAEEVKCQSIAMPAISYGIFGFPLDQCVATIVSAINDNFQSQPYRRTLKKIYLVDISAKVAGAFAKAVDTTYKAYLFHTASPSGLQALELVPPGETPQKPQTQDYVLVSPEGLKIQLVEEGVQNAKAFSDEFDKRSHGNPSDTQGFYGSLSSPTLGVHEMNIGPILFQVAMGDITKEVADVIVNSTSNMFTLKSGVSKAILEGAGPSVEKEFSVLAQQNSEYIVTEGGSLRCKSIIHVVGGNDVKRSVSCVLEECEQRNYSSICLPAIGTGNAQQDPDAVARAIMDAIEEFIQKTSVRAVKKVKVVIFQPHILSVFYDNMKDREGSPAPPLPSLLSKITSFLGFPKHTSHKQKTLFLEKKIEQTVFQVCGIDEDSVECTISWIQNLIAQEQLPYRSDDECVRDFGEKEYKKLNELQERLNIVIELDQKAPLINVTGIIRDVIEARDEIENLIKSIRLAKEKESQADYVLTFVEWRYIDNNVIHCFDKIATMQLEDARQAKHNSTVVKINNQDFTVNLRTNMATGPQGQSVTVQRILKDEAKERVLKKREHQMVIDGKPVTIFLETTKKPVEDQRPSPLSLTQPAEAQSSRPPSVTQSLDEALSDEGPVYNSDDTIVQEVFLAVTAELNCELLSKEQRAHIASVCPGVRSVEREDGIARVCGSFKDIEKIHHFLSMQLLESEQKQKYPTHKYPPSDVERQPPNQQDLGMGFSSSEPKTGLEDDSENCFEVPLLFLEYFRHAYPGRIESIEKEFGVSIEVRDSAPNMASVHFTTGQPGNLEAACQSLVRDFQRYTQALKQDCVSLEDPQRAVELRQELNRWFPKLLIKEQGRKLTLLRSQADISAATEKVSQNSFKTPVEIMSSGYRTGIKADSTHFNLLKPALLQEISEIKQKYNTRVKVQENTQKTCILIDPRDKEVDLSVHSYASFTNAFQHATCQLTTEILPLKHLGKGKAHLHKTKFVDDLKKKHPNVLFVVSKESMTLMGLPNQLAQAKQYMFKRIGLSLPSGESLNVDHKTPMDIDRNDANAASPPLRGSADSSGALKGNDNEDTCAICMDTISNKLVLSKCKHEFCSSCITKALSIKPVCPLCQMSYGIQKGNQPDGTMTFTTSRQSLPGYADCGSIVIQYIIESGIQTDEHPNPGKPYHGTRRTAYLPDNQEGRKVLDLLQKAFQNRLIFTVGDSRVSGMSDVVIWNGIHHKTSTFGGPGNCGYPDPHYLTCVKEELKAKGIE